MKSVRSDICSKNICPTRCLFEVGPNQRRLTDKRKEKQRRKKETEKKIQEDKEMSRKEEWEEWQTIKRKTEKNK